MPALCSSGGEHRLKSRPVFFAVVPELSRHLGVVHVPNVRAISGGGFPIVLSRYLVVGVSPVGRWSGVALGLMLDVVALGLESLALRR